jgi:hypothetical protein
MMNLNNMLFKRFNKVAKNAEYMKTNNEYEKAISNEESVGSI